MGVVLTMVLMLAGSGIGVWSERRYPSAAVGLARRLLVLLLYVLVPIVIFFNLARASITLDNGVGVLLGLLNLTLVSLVVWFLATRLLSLTRPQTGAVICSVLIANTAYLGYPLTVALLGHDALSVGVLFDVLVSSPSLMLGAFGVAAAFGSRAGEGARARVRTFLTRNPPLYAAVLALLVPDALAPTVLVDASQVLAVAMLPIGFFAVGATLADGAEHGELPIPPPLTRPVALAVGARLVLAPALLMLLAAPLIDLPPSYRLLSAMPTGINALVVSHAYGLDNRIVAEAITWSTAIVVIGALASLAF
jgi:malate permease and related proteins